MQEQTNIFEDVSNPLDSVEEIIISNDWTFDRMDEDTLTVHVSGKYGHYKMAFNWQEHYSALKFCCTPDLTVSPNKLEEASKAVNKINSTLWLGHFDIPLSNTANAEAHTPCFRHTSLFRGMNYSSGASHMEDLIDIALSECERYYMTFELLSLHQQQGANALSLAMMDNIGEA